MTVAPLLPRSYLPLTTFSLSTLLRRTLVPLVIAAQLLLLAPIALLPQAAEAAPGPGVTPPTIVPFGDWAPADCPEPPGEDPARTRRVVVHHTYEPTATTRDEVWPALAATCKAHTDRGFSTIGYHYVVDAWGNIYQGRGALPDKHGRPPKVQAQGAHVAGSNSGAVGIVFLGDHTEAPPAAAALESATQLAAWLMEGAGTDPSARVPTVSTGVGTARFAGTFNPQALNGHSDSNHTECPGEGVRRILEPMRERVRQLIAGQEPASWADVAVAQPQEGVAADPAAKKAKAKAKAKAAVRKAAPDQAQAAGKVPANAAAAVQPQLQSGSPLIPAAQKMAGALHSAGLGLLADRFDSLD